MATKAESPKSFWGIIRYEDIEEHFKINVPYYLAKKMMHGVKIENAFKELENKTISPVYEDFINEAIAEFLNEKNTTIGLNYDKEFRC